MHTDHSNHYKATLGMHTGSFTFARPSIGSWVSYGLGTENRNLPSFVVLAPQMPYAGTQVWASDFLPGCHQGTRVVPGAEPIANLSAARRRRELAGAGARRSPRRSTAGTSSDARRRPGAGRADPVVRDGLRHADARCPRRSTCRRRPTRRSRSTA